MKINLGEDLQQHRHSRRWIPDLDPEMHVLMPDDWLYDEVANAISGEDLYAFWRLLGQTLYDRSVQRPRRINQEDQ